MNQDNNRNEDTFSYRDKKIVNLPVQYGPYGIITIGALFFSQYLFSSRLENPQQKKQKNASFYQSQSITGTVAKTIKSIHHKGHHSHVTYAFQNIFKFIPTGFSLKLKGDFIIDKYTQPLVTVNTIGATTSFSYKP